MPGWITAILKWLLGVILAPSSKGSEEPQVVAQQNGRLEAEHEHDQADLQELREASQAGADLERKQRIDGGFDRVRDTTGDPDAVVYDASDAIHKPSSSNLH